ncbi:MAG: dUTP diphosphatase [Myxococcales bacterium]|jgi:dUTP pyrophosphatase|nr:dUTP diphosphatase [Myxococcales bacterium]
MSSQNGSDRGSLRVLVRKVGDVDVPLPKYETAGAAGMDLRAALRAPVTLRPLGRARIPTGLAMAIPAGFEAQVRPRSGLAAKKGITVLNSPGTIDSDYRGPVEVLLVNLGEEEVVIEPLDRIAQMVVAPFTHARLEVVTSLDETARGAGGYGSTGHG